MSSKFLERLDEIREGQPARLGFGAARAQRTPGMALVIDLGDKVADYLKSAIELAPDAIIISSRLGDKGLGPNDAEAVSYTARKTGNANIPWGPRTGGSLKSADTAACREAGADLIVFSLEKTALDAVTSRDAVRILALLDNASPEYLRDIAPLPVDAVLITMCGEPADWTLKDLAAVARVSGRVGKHVLAQVSGIPEPGALEALRDAGVSGLVLEFSLDIDNAEKLQDDPEKLQKKIKELQDKIKKLQADLLDLPKPGARRRSRPSAILPGSVYAPRRPAPADDPDDDDD